MIRAPFFQFYPADYLADERVQAMSIEGEGCYVRLLAYCWREGSIPTDRTALARLCKGYDGPGLDEAILRFENAEKIRKNSKFKGRMVHKRLNYEKAKIKKSRKMLKDAGLRGAEKRWGKDRVPHDESIGYPIPKNGYSDSDLDSDNKKDKSMVLVINDIKSYKAKRVGSDRDPRYREAYEKHKGKETIND